MWGYVPVVPVGAEAQAQADTGQGGVGGGGRAKCVEFQDEVYLESGQQQRGYA